MLHRPMRSRQACLTAALLSGVTALSQAQTLPASVRACAAVKDSLARLVCYDREVARFNAPAGEAAGAAPPAPTVASPAAAVASAAGGAAHAAAAPVAAPALLMQDSGTRSAVAPPAAADTSGVMRAHLVAITHAAGGLVFQLDNGERWQEVQPVAGDLSLRIGDAVQVEHHLGSWWLSGPHVFGMSVRRH